MTTGNALETHYPQAYGVEIQPGDGQEAIAKKLDAASATGPIDHIL